jgi:L-ascorbate metabolism protein UlaG (beta-lactamase superfamily)
MLRFGFALVALVASLLLSAPAQDKTWAPVTISYYGQSFFILKSSKGTTVALDPHFIPEFGRHENLKADIVCCSHLHNDHTAIYALANAKDKDLRVLMGLSGMGMRTTWNHIDETIKDFRFRTVPTYHDDREGLIRGKNSIFLLEVDGWKICHLGDLGHELTPAQLRKIGPVDVLMVPSGGIYTLNGSEAKKAVEQIQPKEYIFPMHYGTKVFDDLLPIDEFLEDQEKKRIAISDDNKVTLNKDKDRPRPLIVQLHYAPKGK